MKLLLVEDDIEISQMLKSYLEAENYEVMRLMGRKPVRSLRRNPTVLYCWT